jgi:DNA-binding IclR family transcriptional regulator
MIKKAREFGFAFSEGIYMEVISGVGVPLYDHKGEIEAAISVASISQGMDIAGAKNIAKFIQSEVSLFH